MKNEWKNYNADLIWPAGRTLRTGYIYKLIIWLKVRTFIVFKVEFLSRFGSGPGAAKVKFDRRRAALDDDDEDF